MSYTQPTETEAAERRLSLQPFDEYNVRALHSIYALYGHPPTHLDLGSGSGVVARAARQWGVDAIGVDVIAEPPDIAHDLTKPLDMGRHFTFITCIEVAEHLPPDAAQTLCATIHRHLEPRGLLVFTSALPGQAGDHHQNLIPPFEWRGLMWEAGLSWLPYETSRLAHIWTLTSGSLHHLPANMQAFTTREGW
jgi:SAM-dependent methyltransferase